MKVSPTPAQPASDRYPITDPNVKAGPIGSTGGPTQATFGPQTDWSNPATVTAYFQSRGVTPSGTSPSYWAQKWNEWGKTDPAYFFQRLQNAEEFGGAPGGGPSEFSDPWGSTLESAVSSLLGKLNAAPQSQYLDQLLAGLQTDQATAKANAKALAGQLTARATELKAPPYTAGNEANIRAQAFDALEKRRQETLKNAKNDVYARGFAPTSGLVQDATNQVNQQFETQRTGIEAGLLNQALAEGQARKNQAVTLEQLAAQALSGGDLQAIQDAATQAQLEYQTNQDALGRAQSAVSAIGVPLNLMASRTASAQQTLNGGSAGDPLSTIMGLLQYVQNNNAISSQNKNAVVSSLFSLFGLLG